MGGHMTRIMRNVKVQWKSDDTGRIIGYSIPYLYRILLIPKVR